MHAPHIELVSLDNAFAIVDGQVIPVTNWFDAEGEDCDPQDAVMCVAGTADFGWVSIELAFADEVTVH